MDLSNFTEISGWIGALAFAFSGLPQAIHSFRYKNSYGITWGLLILWWIGEWGCLFYVLPKGQIPLICNYVGNIVFVGIITYYKIFPGPDHGVYK